MDSFDNECPRCHGKGTGNLVAQPTSPQKVSFNFADDLAADEEKKQAQEKVRKAINRVFLFVGIYLLTQYSFSLYNRHAFEQALLTQYNQQLRNDGAGISCSSAELYGFGIFGTTEATGYIHCSDRMQRRASWSRERKALWARSGGRATWKVEETGQAE
jgi:hypothetical protein